jgi:transcriptional regulator with XRE-family HTH domain
MTLGENIIGKRISAELQKQGKPRKWLAEQIGCTEASMTRYIDGTRIPKATTLGSIAKALQVDANFLLGIEVKMTNADRIRSMSDEELEEWLTSITNDAQRAIVESQCFVDYQWKEWLQSEVEDDTRTSN